MVDIIKIAKLHSGESVIAKIVSENDHTIRLKKPILVYMQEIDGGKVQVGFSPFAPFIKKDEVNLERSSIQYLEEANPNLVTQYIEATTGIKLAETPSLILS